ncbi:MAG: peptide deformylase, partial [Bdellovibrionota bacterium]
EMRSALRSQSDGVAIAAPQIGYSLRIFIVAGKIFDKDFATNKPEDLAVENQIITKETKTKRSDEVGFSPRNF